MSDYLTPREVAKMLSLRMKSLYRLVKSDPSMPVTRLATGTLRFRRDALERWLRDQEQGTPRIRNQMHAVSKPASTKAATSA
jgi:excisionase family DNA binding protein